MLMDENILKETPNAMSDIDVNEIGVSEFIINKWPKENTAILITHGIGNQNPLETLDLFARQLINRYIIAHKNDTTFNVSEGDITITHLLNKKDASDKSYNWYDNFIRIKRKGEDASIDICEYYWANMTENKTNFTNVMSWLRSVVRGAKNHYRKKENAQLSSKTGDTSLFVKNGKFRYFNYWFFVNVVGSITFLFSLIIKGLLSVLKWIPVIGNPLSQLVDTLVSDSILELSNILGDIVIYNDVNERSEFYCIRKDILNGAVKALRFLIEKKNASGLPEYGHVVVAGHSLGSQISFDAINRLTHLIRLGDLPGYNTEGVFINDNKKPVLDREGKEIQIKNIMRTFITFGSPLDKIAFFLREQSGEDAYIRRQLLKNFHSFKQRNWVPLKSNHLPISAPINRLFEDILWRNYYDDNDLVSGSLDFYHNLTNINCRFTNSRFKFTHSNYWNSIEFYGDVWKTILGQYHLKVE